jgi:TolB-like protein/class 3 adenylate cyclase/Tfp pilus assembly protein PilF
VGDNEPVRKLTTIMSADAAEFSRMMRADEDGTFRALRRCRQAIDALIAEHQGRIFGTAGDCVVAEFASPVEALRCAADVQQAIEKIDPELPGQARMRFRIGINLGDVLMSGSDLIGDGVNVADRIQHVAKAGQICISAPVHELVKNQPDFSFEDLGELTLKNIAEPVRVFRAAKLSAQEVRRPIVRRRTRAALRAGGLAALVVCLAAAALAVAFRLGYVPLPAWQSGSHQGSPGSAQASIAVLPFDNLSGDAAQDYFVEGITEDVILALGRFSDLSVIAREAVQQYKGQALRPGALSSELGVRYALQGSVRRDGDRIRVTATLSDAMTGVQLWSDRYDGEVKDMFAVQDDITQKVVGALAIKLSDIERQRALAKPPDNLQAYDYLQRGREYLRRNTRADNREARRMFETALQLDPSYATAYVGLGYTYVAAAFSGWTEQVMESVLKAKEYGQKALELDGSSGEAHALLGTVYLNLGEGERAIAEIRQAIEINPNDAKSYAMLGGALTYSGRPEEAVKAFELAMRLNPDMDVGRFNPVGWAYYLVGRYEDAVKVQEAALRRSPNDYYVHAGLAASYAQLGRDIDAKRAAENTLRTWPFFSAVEFASQFSDVNYVAIVSGLSKAGLK